VVRHKGDLAEVLGVPEAAVRVVAEDMGGNFGTRNSFYPEFALVAWAARRLGRPVKWTCERREAFLTDYQARDLVSTMELALDADGRFLALRGVNTSNVGAHTVTFVPLNKGRELATTVYRVPAAAVRGRAVLSNTSPLSAYRSAGRPQVMFVMERLIDLAARRHGFDRVELRRRNLIPAAAMPYTNPFGIVYDSGDYLAVQDRAVTLADWGGFEARRREAHADHGAARGTDRRGDRHPRGRPGSRDELRAARRRVAGLHARPGAPDQRRHRSRRGGWRLTLGTLNASRRCSHGEGGGPDRGEGRAARGVAPGVQVADLEFSGGRFRVRGTDRAVGLFEVAAAAGRPDAPDDLRGPLDGACDETVSTPSFPYGCAVCEVEVDPETGVVEVARYTSVDDVGRAINPMIVDGQTHGGIVQGLGQALWEHCRYDAESGQLLSATFMEYAMPRADLLPSFTTEISEVPSTSNPLGLRGGGEGGTTPALGAAVNAIVDALAPLGVEHLEMPVTPERVWDAIRTAQRGRAASQSCSGGTRAST
jgi:carbon-monoxide dehydrogenase large subunit